MAKSVPVTSPVERVVVVVAKAQPRELRKLSRLSRRELTALGDSHARACPNPSHLRAAIVKLNEE